VTDFFDH